MDLWKPVVGKVVGGLVAVGVVMVAISWWRMEPASRDAVWSAIGHSLLWIGLVAVVPWATFFVVPWINRRDSNAWGVALVFTYTALEALLLAWLFDFAISGAMGWTGFLFGILLAGAYNLLVLDWLAEKLGS